jgi:hypothetical protein
MIWMEETHEMIPCGDQVVEFTKGEPQWALWCLRL